MVVVAEAEAEAEAADAGKVFRDEAEEDGEEDTGAALTMAAEAIYKATSSVSVYLGSFFFSFP